MGILTTKESARSFSSYVTAFGLALLISSIIYLRRLENSAEYANCILSDSVNETIPLCSQIKSWRVAAIVGIIIGVIDTLIMPFLYCCICCTAVCGCAACLVFGCPDLSSEDDKKKTGDAEVAETTTINVESDDQPKPTDKFNVENVPSKLQKWLNALGWILWVASPFLATLYITIALYKYDAIRTNNDELFKSALALFVIALFNLMVYFQKFMNSICGYGHEKPMAYTDCSMSTDCPNFLFGCDGGRCLVSLWVSLLFSLACLCAGLVFIVICATIIRKLDERFGCCKTCFGEVTTSPSNITII